MGVPKKMAFVFGDVTFTITPDDIEAVLVEYEKDNPGKSAQKMSSDEFSRRVMDRMKANAKLTRTVLHN